ncbi:uncharacterized protein LOC134260573, partial [Saccostrea cucullata]|uniref:uncharacterized protein LOC134260573 n=1 Tax=Saccostrea cuccullata TaxID=36930 RepID=UPI002ED0EBBB
METAIDTNDLSKLLSVTSNVHTYRNLPNKLVLFLPKFYSEKIQELNKLFGTLSSSSLTSDIHGYSIKTTQKSPEAGSSPPVKHLLDEPETVTTIETEYGCLNNVACLNEEEIWTSGGDSTMKLYSINQGSLLKSIPTKSGKLQVPYDIAVTKNGDLVYTDYKDRTVNIVKNEKIEVIRRKNWKPSGVCSTSSGDLLVIMSKAFGPRGITTDSQSRILTADINNDCVYIIDQDGQFLRYINSCGLSRPCGLCTDTNDNLFVAQWGNKQ